MNNDIVSGQNPTLIKRTYGRKKHIQLLSPNISKRRESNTSLSSLFFYPKKNNCTELFSPFKSLQKFITVSTKSIFDSVPNLSPIQINALAKPKTEKKRPRVQSKSQLVEHVIVGMAQSSPTNLEKETEKNYNNFLPSQKDSNTFSKHNFCLSYEISENPFIENSATIYNTQNFNTEKMALNKISTDLTEKNGLIDQGENKSLLLVPEAPLETKKIGNEDPVTLNLLLHACDQESVLDFKTFITEFKEHYIIEKVGESSYSEVFKCTPVDEDGPQMALKIIPLNIVNEDIISSEPIPHRSRPRDVLHELLITQTLSPPDTVPPSWNGFIRLFGAALVSGIYPSILIDSWTGYSDRLGSENICPSVLDQFTPQHYMILLLEYGGVDLEQFSITSQVQLKSLFCQLLLALYFAQNKYQFEHRDLHLGNILIHPVAPVHEISIPLEFEGILPKSISSEGIQATIIDYSLSRLEPGGHRQGILYADLELDIEIFSGDSRIDIQYEVYRKMRNLLGYPEISYPNWESFYPDTNILWLQFVADKLIRKTLKIPNNQNAKLRMKRFLAMISSFCKNNMIYTGISRDFVINLWREMERF